MVLELEQFPVRHVASLFHLFRVLYDVQVDTFRESLLGQSQERGVRVGVHVAQLQVPLVYVQCVFTVHHRALGLEALDLEDLGRECPAVFYVQVHVLGDAVQVLLVDLQHGKVVAFDGHVQRFELRVFWFQELEEGGRLDGDESRGRCEAYVKIVRFVDTVTAHRRWDEVGHAKDTADHLGLEEERLECE